MYNHTSSVYNNSLLRVPINPIVGQPLPRYEQDCTYHLETQNRKKFTEELDEMARKKYLDKETTKSFVDFFNDIPEYHQVNHLSNSEFYQELEKLKLKKKAFEDSLHKEIKFDPKNSEAIEDFKNEKLGRNRNKGKTKATLKPFCATPINKPLNQILTPDIDSEFSDKEEMIERKKSTLKPFSKTLRPAFTPDIDSEFSDKDISTKPPSRRSVRIETPSDKFSFSGTPEPHFRTKSRAYIGSHNIRSSGNLTDWEDFSSKSKRNFSPTAQSNTASSTVWKDFKPKSKVTYSPSDLKEPLSDWKLIRSHSNLPYSDLKHKDITTKLKPDNISPDFKTGQWQDSRPKLRRYFSSDEIKVGEISPQHYWKSRENTVSWEGKQLDLKPNFSSDDLKTSDWEESKMKPKTNFSPRHDWEDSKSKSRINYSPQDLRSSENLTKLEDSRPKSRAKDFKTSGNITDWEDFSIENLNLNSDCNSPEPLQTRSAPTTPTKTKSKTNWNSGGITIPKPFQMTVRDEENKIVEELYVKMKKPKEEKPEMFKAHDVPIESQIPLFEKIVAEQHRRSFIAKEKRKAALRAHVKPFSFTKRDEEIQELTRELSKSSPNLYTDPPLKIKKFKAKPIPRNLFSNYIYRKMHEDEYYRALQKKIRAEELFRAASLPPSMAKRERTKPKLNVCPRSYSSLSKEEKPIKKSKSVPDYKIYHDKYEKELEDLKNEFISTSPRPFKLKTSKRGRRHLRLSSASSKSSSSKTTTSPSFNTSSINTSNLAAVLRIQSARNKLEVEMLKKLEEAQLREEMRWREKLFRKKPIWQTLGQSHEEDLAMRLQLRRDEERLRHEEHKMRMQLMYGRVQQKPTLFERQSQMKYPKTREELEDQLRIIYGKPLKKHTSERSNLSHKMSTLNDCNENFNSDMGDSEISKEKESMEEKEKCDCLSDDMSNDKY